MAVVEIARLIREYDDELLAVLACGEITRFPVKCFMNDDTLEPRGLFMECGCGVVAGGAPREQALARA